MQFMNTKCVKTTGMGYQFIIVMAGLGTSVYSIVRLFGTPIKELQPTILLFGKSRLTIGGILIGLLTIIIGTVGLLTHFGNKSAMRFLVLEVALILLFCVAVFATVHVKEESNMDQIRSRFSRMWDTAEDSLILRIQDIGECCGFESYEDRIQDPCTEYEQRIGCWSGIIEPVYMHTLKEIIVPGSILTVVLGIGMLLNLLTVIAVIKDSKPIKVLNGQRQPFDAWHRAVFQ